MDATEKIPRDENCPSIQFVTMETTYDECMPLEGVCVGDHCLAGDWDEVEEDDDRCGC